MGNFQPKFDEPQDENKDEQKQQQIQESEKKEKIVVKKKNNNTSFTLEQSQSLELKIVPADECESKIDVTVNQVKFWSNFDSGNLAKVQHISGDEYSLTIGRDCAGREPPLNYHKNLRQWFYFKIQSEATRTITCHLENMEPRQFFKIWNNDKDIFMREGNGSWIRKGLQGLEKQETKLRLTFTLDLQPNTVLSVASCLPWSYTHNQKYISQMKDKFQEKGYYFFRETLTNSFEGRPIELVTISAPNQQLSQNEDIYGGETLFPSKVTRPLRFNKPYIFLSCRIHAGETPASYIMKGLLDFLSSDDSEAKLFLENYVLILIPMLNPDGVYRGHYRLDALGYDCNRVYNRVYKKKKFPQNYAVIETAKYYGERCKVYIDLHAHSQISNTFAFTNSHPDPKTHVEILLFPEFMSLLLDHFTIFPKKVYGEKKPITPEEEYEGHLTENPQTHQPDEIDWHPSKHMIRDSVLKVVQNDGEEQKDQSNLQGKKRVYSAVPGFTGIAKQDVFYSSAINMSYTLEANYRYYYIKEGGSTIKKKFSSKHWTETGQAIILSLLEMDNLRGSKSVLKQNGFESLEELKAQIASILQEQ